MSPVIIRASSLWRLLDCPLAWAKEHMEGYRRPASDAAWIGTAVHRSTAVYDEGRLSGSGVTADDAAGVLVDTIREPDEEVDWGGVSKRDAERRGLTVHTRYCNDVAPGHQYTAVELDLDPLDIDMGEGLVITLTGTLDRIRKDGESHGISDVKTGVRAVGSDGQAVTSKHGPQLGVYTLLAEQKTGIHMDAPGEIIGLQTTNQARVGLGYIDDPRRALVGDDENPGYLDFVAQYFKTGLFPPNCASQLCSARYCAYHPHCIYRT